jgi:outer membrane protein assembly factor BamB
VGGWDGNLYCLNAQDGSNVWTYTTQHSISASPAVSDGVVYITSWDSSIYALGTEAAKESSTGLSIWVIGAVVIVIVIVLAVAILLLRKCKS